MKAIFPVITHSLSFFQMSVVQKIAVLFDNNTDSINIRAISQNPTRVSWTNVTIVDPLSTTCPEEHIQYMNDVRQPLNYRLLMCYQNNSLEQKFRQSRTRCYCRLRSYKKCFFLFCVFFDVESESEVRFCRSPLVFEL